jgi:hypothetical protein
VMIQAIFFLFYTLFQLNKIHVLLCFMCQNSEKYGENRRIFLKIENEVL